MLLNFHRVLRVMKFEIKLTYMVSDTFAFHWLLVSLRKWFLLLP